MPKTKNESKPKIIKEKIYIYLELDEILKGSLNEVAKNILAIEDKILPIHKERYYDFEIEYDAGGYDENSIIIVRGIRTETPEELAARLALNKKQNQLQKARALKLKKTKIEKEIKLYEKLKDKYGCDDII